MKPVVQGGDDFRPVGIAIAPDGSLYLSDWVDKSYDLHGKGRVWRLRRAESARGGRPPERIARSCRRPLIAERDGERAGFAAAAGQIDAQLAASIPVTTSSPPISRNQRGHHSVRPHRLEGGRGLGPSPLVRAAAMRRADQSGGQGDSPEGARIR